MNLCLSLYKRVRQSVPNNNMFIMRICIMGIHLLTPNIKYSRTTSEEKKNRKSKVKGPLLSLGERSALFFPSGKKEVEGKRVHSRTLFPSGTKKNSTFFFVPGGKSHLLFPLGLRGFYPQIFGRFFYRPIFWGDDTPNTPR